MGPARRRTGRARATPASCAAPAGRCRAKVPRRRSILRRYVVVTRSGSVRRLASQTLELDLLGRGALASSRRPCRVVVVTARAARRTPSERAALDHADVDEHAPRRGGGGDLKAVLGPPPPFRRALVAWISMTASRSTRAPASESCRRGLLGRGFPDGARGHEKGPASVAIVTNSSACRCLLGAMLSGGAGAGKREAGRPTRPAAFACSRRSPLPFHTDPLVEKDADLRHRVRDGAAW